MVTQPTNTIQPTSVVLSALFRDYQAAAKAYRWLQTQGHNKNNISLLMSDTTAPRFHAIVNDDKIDGKVVEPKGSYVTGALGATVGAGVLATIGFLAGGPIGAALAASIPGAMVGGLVGGLVGYGYPEEVAKEYEYAIEQGAVVLGVTLDQLDDVDDLEQQLSSMQGEEIIVVA
jgi:hypothetical protein